MIKLVFFVHCKSWKNGGYENTHYFQTENEARSWAKTENQRLQKISGEYGIEVRSWVWQQIIGRISLLNGNGGGKS